MSSRWKLFCAVSAALASPGTALAVKSVTYTTGWGIPTEVDLTVDPNGADFQSASNTVPGTVMLPAFDPGWGTVLNGSGVGAGNDGGFVSWDSSPNAGLAWSGLHGSVTGTGYILSTVDLPFGADSPHPENSGSSASYNNPFSFSGTIAPPQSIPFDLSAEVDVQLVNQYVPDWVTAEGMYFGTLALTYDYDPSNSFTGSGGGGGGGGGAGSADWNSSLNWTSAVPNGSGAFAGFYSGAAFHAVNVDAPTTVGGLVLDDTTAYTISGTNMLTFDAPTSQNNPNPIAQIVVQNGTHTINAPITLAKDTFIDINNSADSLTLANTLTASGITVTKQGNGALHEQADLLIGDTTAATFNHTAGNVTVDDNIYLGKSATGSGTYNLSGGTLFTSLEMWIGRSGSGTVNQSGGSLSALDTLHIASNSGSSGAYYLSGGTLETADLFNNGTFSYTGGTANVETLDGTGATTVGPGAILAVDRAVQGVLTLHGTVQVRQNGGIYGASKIGTLTMGSSAQLDLKDNDLIVSASGSTGTWDGSKYTGIQGLVASGRDGTNWDGPGIITSMTDAHLTADYTTLGVAKAGDVLGIADSATATWAGQSVTGAATLVKYTYGGDANLDGLVDSTDQALFSAGESGGLTGWYHGDFNYDGLINIDDETIIDTNITQQGNPLAVRVVPEPASSTALILGLGVILRRRRRRGI